MHTSPFTVCSVHVCVWCSQKLNRKGKRTTGEGESDGEGDDMSGKGKNLRGRRKKGPGEEGDGDDDDEGHVSAFLTIYISSY